MALGNLPESWLYNLIPEAVIGLDQRNIIAAVVGGFEDHINDLRSYASKFELLLDPLAETPEGEFSAIQSFQDGPKTTFTFTLKNVPLVPGSVRVTCATNTSIDHDGIFPPSGIITGGTVDYASGLCTVTLSTSAMGVTATYRFYVGDPDPLRQVDVNLLQYLADTVGAVLYNTQETDPQLILAGQRKMMAAYFPRLKIKGTGKSFEVLGKIIGFDDIKMTPLWGRVTPRIPNDVGNAANDPDFAYIPEIEPTTDLTGIYNPLVMNDGPFYSWTSSTLSETPSSTDFWVESVNGFNPWVNVVETGSVHTQPAAGDYYLAGGGPYTKASVSLGPNTYMRLDALAEGTSFDGILCRVAVVSGSLRTLSILNERLSSIKYRTSFYNLTQSMDMDAFVQMFGELRVSKNTDLEDNPTLCSDGTAVSPFRPWKGSLPRTQATVTDAQFDMEKLRDIGLQSKQQYEEVRPMSRTPRQVLVGFTMLDNVEYAPYPERTTLFTTNGSTSVFSGVLVSGSGSNITFPLPTYTAEIEIWHGSNYELMSGEADLASSGSVINYGADGVSGFYNFGSNSYSFTIVPGSLSLYGSSTNFVARWIATTTEVIRPEPETVLKYSGTGVTYQVRPEDEPTIPPDGDGQYDEYIWRRDLRGDGEEVDRNLYRTRTPDLSVVVEDSPVVLDQSGVEYVVEGYDSQTDGLTSIRFSAVERPSTIADGYKPGKTTIGQDGSGYNYYIGYTQGVFVADPSTFFSPPHRDGLTGWLAFNEHPEEDVDVIDHSNTASVQTVTGILPGDRVYDDDRGWYLNIEEGGSVISDAYRGITDEFTVSFWIQPGISSGTGSSKILDYGPLSAQLSNNDIAGKWNLDFYLENDSGIPQMLTTVSGSHSNFYFTSVSWGSSAGKASIALSDIDTAITSLTSVSGSYREWTSDDTVLTITGSQRGYGIHDMRIWNTLKSISDIENIRLYKRKKAGVAYNTSIFKTRSRHVNWALRVLKSGFVVSFPAPPTINLDVPEMVSRYDDQGRYVGESRRKEQGLGGGDTPPLPWKLGTRFYDFPAVNERVVATPLSAIGVNAVWENDVTPGSYIRVNSAGSGPTGRVTSVVSTGTTTPWPNPQNDTNPGQEFIWIKGDDGRVYEITVNSSGSMTTLAADPVYLDREALETTGCVVASTLDPRGRTMQIPGTYNWTPLLHTEQPTGAATEVVRNLGSNTISTLSVNSSGIVYEKVSSGTTPSRPYQYLYTFSQAVDTKTQSEAYASWNNPTDFGYDISTVARDDAGVLSISNTGSLEAGKYQLVIDVGNVGLADTAFDGFNTNITIGGVITLNGIILTKLSSKDSRNSPRAETTVEFTLTSATPSVWDLEVEWTNDHDVPEKGQYRQIAIYGYEVRRLVTQIYRIDLTGVDYQLTPIDINVNKPSPPGGWILSLNSYGSAVVDSYGSLSGWQHESSIFPSNDTVTSLLPLAGILTGCSSDHREGIEIVSIGGSAYDPVFVLPAPPILGAITAYPDPAYYLNNVDLIVQTVQGTSLEYVWTLWDGTYTITSTGTLTALDNRQVQIPVTVYAVDPYGQISSSVAAFVSKTAYMFISPAGVILQAPDLTWWRVIIDASGYIVSQPTGTPLGTIRTTDLNISTTDAIVFRVGTTCHELLYDVTIPDQEVWSAHPTPTLLASFTYTTDLVFSSGHGPVIQDTNLNNHRLTVSNGGIIGKHDV